MLAESVNETAISFSIDQNLFLSFSEKALFKALDLLEKWINSAETEKECVKREIFAHLDISCRLDFLNSRAFLIRANLYSGLFFDPELACKDLTYLINATGSSFDIHIFCHESIAHMLSSEGDDVEYTRGNRRFCLHIHETKGNLYYRRFKMEMAMEDYPQALEDLKRSAILGHEKAILELKEKGLTDGRLPLARYIRV